MIRVRYVSTVFQTNLQMFGNLTRGKTATEQIQQLEFPAAQALQWIEKSAVTIRETLSAIWR